MARKRVYEIARELGITSRELLKVLEELGMEGLRAVSTVSEEEAQVIKDLLLEHAGKAEAPAPEMPARGETPAETGAPVEVAAEEREAPPKEEKKGMPRPPVVAVLGHIDHGKTTLLDTIRKTKVAEREAGGITQSIGAYQVNYNGRTITFVDTPGHRAFTAMRARGAQVTDIAILVVAADDGVMAQTVEAIDHIKAAEVPMIVAINKIDKPNANPDKVRQQLADMGFVPEEWGGDTIMVPISALKGDGVDELLEMILLVADLQDIRGDPKGELEAWVIESHLDPARGPEATVIVKNGTLRVRDVIVVGTTWGRIRALVDHQGNQIKEATPGMPAQILGLNDVPQPGERVERVKSPKEAEKLVSKRIEVQRRPPESRFPRTFEELFAQKERKRLKLVLKAATVGALEAAKLELGMIHIEHVDIELLHAGVGPITESDILLAASVEGGEPLVIGFGVRVDPKARKVVEQYGVPVRTYEIIYDLIQDIERAGKMLLGPQYVETKVGEAEVLRTFKVSGVGVVAGCRVRSGKVIRNGKVKVLREGQEVFTGEIASLKHFAQDVQEMREGQECGIRIKDFDKFKPGDILEVYEVKVIQPA